MWSQIRYKARWAVVTDGQKPNNGGWMGDSQFGVILLPLAQGLIWSDSKKKGAQSDPWHYHIVPNLSLHFLLSFRIIPKLMTQVHGESAVKLEKYKFYPFRPCLVHFFLQYPSQRIFEQMYGVLNAVEKNKPLYNLTINDETNFFKSNWFVIRY